MFLLVVGFLAALSGSAHAGQCVCVATWGGGTLNIRSCASTGCGILGVESPGNCYSYYGSSGGWHNFDYGGQDGWASGEYMSGPQECADNSIECFGQLCQGNANSVARGCDAYGCGNYGASRGSRAHGGVDVVCSANSDIYAPISGTFGRAIPYGDGTCCDDGFFIDGTGTWAGHSIMVFYTEPNSGLIGGSVSQGQTVGYHIGLHCSSCYATTMTDHSHIQDDYQGSEIDPAGWLYC